MKNLKRWFPPILVFLFIFTLVSCGEECPPCNENSDPVAAPEQIVKVEDAKLMYDTYSVRRKPLIRHYEDSINRRRHYDRNDKMQQQNKEDTKSAIRQAVQADSFPVARYVYYDYETIKNYLKYIEQEAKDQGIEISTLRFYFSNYPDGMRVEHAESRQNSIFIMPTLTQNNQTYGYFLNDKEQVTLLADDLNVSKTPFKPTVNSDKAKASLMPELNSSSSTLNYSLSGGKSYILNSGSGVPPPYH